MQRNQFVSIAALCAAMAAPALGSEILGVVGAPVDASVVSDEGFKVIPAVAAQGELAPAFTLKDRTGKDVSLSQFKGKVVVLDFFATWCLPCRSSIPALGEVYKRNASKGLVVIGVNLREDEATVKSMEERIGHAMAYPVVFDTDKTVGNAYGVRAIPTFVVIGKDGKILAVGVGGGFVDQIEGIFQKALSGGKTAA